MRFSTTAAVAALSAALPSAAMVRHCPGSSSEGCFLWGVPPSSSSSSSSDAVYFRLEAPSTYQWVGLGIGSRMVGSDMFIIYPDGSGNVTLSTRSASSHSEPDHESRSGVELLAGSGIENGTMIANVRCSGDCSGDLDRSGTNSWIAAWRSEDGGLDTSETDASIGIHDDTYSFSIDLSRASIASDSNPFEGVARSDSDSGAGSDSNGDSDGDGAASGGASGGSSFPSQMIITAHGVVMAITFAILYPVGAIVMPILGKWLIHGVVQLVAFLAMWAGFGLGYYYSNGYGTFFTDTHTRVGTIVVALLGIQPILGVVHHAQFKKHQRRTISSHVHIWYGRILMAVGIINGGMGLRQADSMMGFKIGYAVVAGVFGGLYIGAAIWGMLRRRRAQRVTSKGSGMSG